MNMENKFTKIEYMKKKDINFNEENTTPKAIAVINGAEENDNLILRISINSPVLIEDAAPLTKEGIISICKGE